MLFPLQYRRRALAWLFMNPQQWIHLRELARVTGSTPGTLKKEVDALLATGLIQMRAIIGGKLIADCSRSYPTR